MAVKLSLGIMNSKCRFKNVYFINLHFGRVKQKNELMDKTDDISRGESVATKFMAVVSE